MTRDGVIIVALSASPRPVKSAITFRRLRTKSRAHASPTASKRMSASPARRPPFALQAKAMALWSVLPGSAPAMPSAKPPDAHALDGALATAGPHLAVGVEIGPLGSSSSASWPGGSTRAATHPYRVWLMFMRLGAPRLPLLETSNACGSALNTPLRNGCAAESR
jgi:hypothetical protein